MIKPDSYHLENHQKKIRFVDLFCGLGGFRIAIEAVCQEKNIQAECVFSSDIDLDAQITYEANFNEKPFGDIVEVNAADIPDHDILMAGFPCQAFSICGDRRGFDDTRGTLFFEIARILEKKQPPVIVLENVKQLKTHNSGKTLSRIIETLNNLGYYVEYQVLNALNFGVPQKRERIFIVGFRQPSNFSFPIGDEIMKPLSLILEEAVSDFYYASAQIRQNRLERTVNKRTFYSEPTIWHENKGGNISIYPYSCAMRAGASYNYLLVNGERRLTEREMLRLQGFPDSYKIVCGYAAMRKLAGNSVAIPCVIAVLRSVLKSLLLLERGDDSELSLRSQGTLSLELDLFSKREITKELAMTLTTEDAKKRLDSIINKARVDLYKPIQIAEVLRRSRLVGDIDILDVDSYKNQSLRWRDEVTLQLSKKKSNSSAQYQHDVWNKNAMPPDILSILDTENKSAEGAVERYIYMRYSERQGTVSSMLAAISTATPETFQLPTLLQMFVRDPGIRRSVDKAYEVVTYSLLETLVTSLKTTIKVSVPTSSRELLKEFSDLAKMLLGIDENQLEWEQDAHIYRVGVTNAADRGLDMWANFGIAVQVKHLTLNPELANRIVDQVESDHIVIVCRDADFEVIRTLTMQIGWGRRVRGVITESNLIEWYERCLRGKFSHQLAKPLLEKLVEGFNAEFPQCSSILEFLKERQYDNNPNHDLWQTDTEKALTTSQIKLF